MGVKHKKTRKQKIIADSRHQVYAWENKTSLPTPTINTVIVNKNSDVYSYILHDVLKTGLLTFSIIIGELILFFLLKNHIIKLPNIIY
ncbi:MAG: hypothetical protein HY424_02730 [Candidatus Levybacteria bacterium]|nr:hypothetical protein [Candidatus Levybacteria bacterium]